MLFRKTFTAEPDLIKGCLQGDRVAQEFLYKTYSGRFLSLCARYVKDKILAEDVMIEGFVKIFEKLPQFEAKGSFEGWMKRIMVTQALLTLRDHKNLSMEINMDDHLDLVDQTFEINYLEAEDLLELIQELPTGYRSVFNLYAIEGFSHSEIATLLGISESTSKSQLNRGRNLLKQKLAEQQVKERRING